MSTRLCLQLQQKYLSVIKSVHHRAIWNIPSTDASPVLAYRLLTFWSLTLSDRSSAFKRLVIYFRSEGCWKVMSHIMTTQHERIHVYAMYRYMYMQRMFTTDVCMHVYICNVVISIKKFKAFTQLSHRGVGLSYMEKRNIHCWSVNTSALRVVIPIPSCNKCILAVF